jgi:hypothetical protein
MKRSVIIGLLALAVGSYSMTIASYAMSNFHEICSGTAPDKDWVSQAGLLVMGVGFVLVLFLRAQTAIFTGAQPDSKEVALYVALGLGGGIFTVFKTMDEAGKDGLPLIWRVSSAIYIVLIVVVLFLAAAFVASRPSKGGTSAFARFSYRVAVAALIAGTAGAAIQFAFVVLAWKTGQGHPLAECTEKHLSGLFRYGTTQFFISAPMTAFVFALYATANSVAVRAEASRGRQRAWTALAILGAVALSSFYALAFYDHGMTPQFRVFAFLMLQMPSVCGGLMVGVFARRETLPLWHSLVTSIVGFVLAYYIASQFGIDQDMTEQKKVMFALAHGITAFFTVLGVGFGIQARFSAQPATPVSPPSPVVS